MLCASQSQAWEVMHCQNAMEQTLPTKESAKAQKEGREEGRDFLWFLSVSFQQTIEHLSPEQQEMRGG